jgi:hypothetical protein
MYSSPSLLLQVRVPIPITLCRLLLQRVLLLILIFVVSINILSTNYEQYYCSGFVVLRTSTITSTITNTRRGQSIPSIRNPCSPFRTRTARERAQIIQERNAIVKDGVDNADNTDNADNEEVRIQIFDNAFSSFACEELTYLTQDHSTRGNDGSSIFTRPPNNDKPLTPIENAIHSFLVTVNDTTKKVEYWSRDEYINIDAHADIDEEQLQDENELRCPKMAHVLYLEVQDGLRGPTCVFPRKRIGWDGENVNNDNNDKMIDLLTVPAIQGRVLRFPGNAMHSVPCPADRWLLSKEEERLLIEKEEKECEEEVDDDDDYYDFDEEEDDDDDEDIERAVLLFNTWPDHEPGPKGVGGDYATGALPEGIELSEEDSISFLQSEGARRLVEWEEEYGTDAKEIRCNPMEKWESIDIVLTENEDENDSQNIDEIRVGLMGRQNRRLYHSKFVELTCSSKLLRKALIDEKTPHLIQLSSPLNTK